MQSSLPTTIYVQNLSFFVTQISTSFFYLTDLHDIYGDKEQAWSFLTPAKKRVKFEIFEKSQILKNQNGHSTLFYSFFSKIFGNLKSNMLSLYSP